MIEHTQKKRDSNATIVQYIIIIGYNKRWAE